MLENDLGPRLQWLDEKIEKLENEKAMMSSTFNRIELFLQKEQELQKYEGCPIEFSNSILRIMERELLKN